MKSADDALYEAKRAGKNTFRIAQPDYTVSGAMSASRLRQ